MNNRRRTIALAALLAATIVSTSAADQPSIGAKPPKGAVVLIGNGDFSEWRGDNFPWTVLDDNVIEVRPGGGTITTKREFRDYRLHVEFMTPYMPEATSQARGNSGCFQQGQWEIQILDSFMNDTYKAGGCAAIYGFKDPDKSVAKPPLQWQTYDVTFRGARLHPDGSVSEPPRLTLVWNGVTVHKDVSITIKNTAGATGKIVTQGPITLQDHSNRVRFRNMWIQELKR